MDTPLAPELDGMDNAALRAFAKERDIKVTALPNVKDDTLRTQIRASLAERTDQAPLPVDTPLAPELVETAVNGSDEAEQAEPSPLLVSDPTIAYVHADNGSCDAYPVNDDGHVLAPASAASRLACHGFYPIPKSEQPA